MINSIKQLESLKNELLSYSTKKSILVVDDDTVTRKIMESSLSPFFEKVITANNGNNALYKYGKYADFDLIVLDIMMPDMDGVEFSKTIKDFNPAQPIIIISSENDNGLFQDLIEIGVNSFIKKPFELLKILPKLIDFFSKEHYKEEIKKSKSADIVILEHRVDKLTDLLKKSLYEIDMIRQELSHKKNQSEEDIDNEELSFAADDLEIVGIETINMEESTSTPAPEITEETKVEDNNEATSCLHSSAKDFMLALRMMKIGKLINQI